MTRTSARRVRVSICLATVLVPATLGGMLPAASANGREVPDDVLRVAEQIASLPATRPEQVSTSHPPTENADAADPASQMREEIARLREGIGGLRHPESDRASSVLKDLEQAYSLLIAGSEGLVPDHLPATLRALVPAAAKADALSTTRRPEAHRLFDGMGTRLAGVAGGMARDVLAVAERAGVRSGPLSRARSAIDAGDRMVARGQSSGAVAQFAEGLKVAADTIAFDPDLFEQNVRTSLAGEVIGATYSINVNGQLYVNSQPDSMGSARTAADASPLPQSPTKEMHVASVSKTITAVTVLDALESVGLTADAEIGPYFPSNWTLGEGVAELTFRRLMTHTSGFGQNINSSSSLYANLQSLAALPVPAVAGFNYENANYGMLRVLTPGLFGIDTASQPSPDVFDAAFFFVYSRAIMNSAGITLSCGPTDPTPTLYYNEPADSVGSLPGMQLPSYVLQCGGFGFYVSSNQLGKLSAIVRYTNELLSTEGRKVMNEGFLGWMDPANYNTNVVPDGAFGGPYLMHGGDWDLTFPPAPQRGHDNCVARFPITVEASLSINSVGGTYPYQCRVLSDSFDNAWVAK